MEDTRTCYVVAYWGDIKDVRYTNSEYGNEDANKLFHAMEEYLTCGYVVEILDVVRAETDMGVSDRCDRWREVLRQQGYNMGGED